MISVCDSKLSFSFETESDPGWRLSLHRCWEKSSRFYSIKLSPPVDGAKTCQEGKGCLSSRQLSPTQGTSRQPKGVRPSPQGQPKYNNNSSAPSSYTLVAPQTIVLDLCSAALTIKGHYGITIGITKSSHLGSSRKEGVSGGQEATPCPKSFANHWNSQPRLWNLAIKYACTCTYKDI